MVPRFYLSLPVVSGCLQYTSSERRRQSPEPAFPFRGSDLNRKAKSGTNAVVLGLLLSGYPACTPHTAGSQELESGVHPIPRAVNARQERSQSLGLENQGLTESEC